MFKLHPLQIGPSRSMTRKPKGLWAEPWMVWRENGWRELTCPACLDTHLMPKRIDANPPFKPRERYALYQCEACGTLHYPDVEVFEYESRRDADLARKFYLEVGAGLDAMIAPLAWAGLDDVDSLLEVGGGYGFSVDFASRELGWSSANIDPSFLARTGARDLGHTHVAAYLSPDHRMADQSFDRVLSSEVIEHVKAPDPFLEALGAALSPDGVLLLTTPNAAVVSEDASLDTLLPVITAGHHVIIFSRDGLTATLQRAGYEHIVVEEAGLTLQAAAAHRPINVDFNARPDRSRLQSYLAGRLDALGDDHALFAGFAVRLMKEYVHTGKWEEANAIRLRIKQRWLEDYGLNLDLPGSLKPEYARKEKGERRLLRKFAANHPFSLTIALYYAACIDRQLGKTGQAIAGFEAARRVADTLHIVFSSMYAACRETEDLALRSQLAAAELSASGRPQHSARLLMSAMGKTSPAQKADWYRIACHTYAAGALTGRREAVIGLEPFVRGHLEQVLITRDLLSPVEGYAAAGLAEHLATLGEDSTSHRLFLAAAAAMTDEREREVFHSRASAIPDRSADHGAALITAMNANDAPPARSAAQSIKDGSADISSSVAFALGLFHLNIEPDATEAMRWFAVAAERSVGDDRIDAELHLAIAAQRLPDAQRREALPALLKQLQKAKPANPILGSRIKDLAATYSAGEGTKEALS